MEPSTPAKDFVMIKDLKSVVALMDLPDTHLQWIIDHSLYREYEDGELIGQYGMPAEYMWIGLTGKVTFYMWVNGKQVYYFTFENDTVTGGIGGLMPYSRMKTFPGYSYALGKVKVLRLHKDHFPALEQLNPDFIQKLIGYMTERARAFATTKLQHEKVDALGNLAAGIAHELNNPAAAIRSISNELTERLSHNYQLTGQLIGADLWPDQLLFLSKLVAEKESKTTPAKKMTALERSQYEDDLSDWFEDKGIKEKATAESFSDLGFTIEEMESIFRELGEEKFKKTIPWLENLISSKKIIGDLAEASTRISHLVSAIKSHVHMDQTNELQPTDIHQDIENTITLLGFKFREKNIEVKKDFCKDMPMVPAYVGELNQVWTNLIDNAIFAVNKNGIISIGTSCDAREVRVSIIDNGSGIPKEIISRIFDPFFTTKKVGEGTGIGLDTVSRIVRRHQGEIKVNSEPGRTQFIVIIPALPKQD